jgi:peptidoglycan LD-endopeptidase LytH
MRKVFLFLMGFVVVAGIVLVYFYFQSPFGDTINAGRHQKVSAFIRSPEDHQDWVIQAGNRCADAPFIFPTNGFAGYLWGDSFRPGHEHQGLDIFSGTQAGITPVYAAFDGYLTRLPDWKSTVIIRIANDPLQPGRQIWTYYTHMADRDGSTFIAEDFPPGTYEVFVPAGTLLGYQGNFSGTPGNPTGVHLHFSIVKDDDSGSFLNELEIKNTIDPGPYFGMLLNASLKKNRIPACPIE